MPLSNSLCQEEGIDCGPRSRFTKVGEIIYWAEPRSGMAVFVSLQKAHSETREQQ
ncbi:hypothetical protein JOE21_002115 [Desmospora profundinema]|uniref:Uncharacterized protein n=1 Tax=Desmospora profundinema TaxID=1571184 RepID=A0ABU1IQA4_9BACL|nr:hypothetical protein [Desmospora profundinema]